MGGLISHSGAAEERETRKKFSTVFARKTLSVGGAIFANSMLRSAIFTESK